MNNQDIAFNIGDRVKVTGTAYAGQVGVVEDVIYSSKAKNYLYAVQMDDSNKTVNLLDHHLALEQQTKQDELEVEYDIANNVVVVMLYKVRHGYRVEVARGHGHLIHGGTVGFAQAFSYAARKAYEALSEQIPTADQVITKRNGYYKPYFNK